MRFPLLLSILILPLLISCSPDYTLLTSIPFTYNTSNSAGFSLGTDPLNFGSGPYGSNLIREISLRNDFSDHRRFQFRVRGGGHGAVFFSPSSSWTMSPNETRWFEIRLMVGNNSVGQYDGFIDIYQKPSMEENTHELLWLPDVFDREHLWGAVFPVMSCSEKNIIVSNDLGFSDKRYWRIIHSSR